MAQQRLGNVTWNGLTFGPGTPYAVTAVEGLDDLPAIRGEDVERTGQHGDYTGPDFTGPRVVQLGLGIRGASPDDLRALTLALRNATQPQAQPAQLAFVDQGMLVYGKVRKRSLPYDAERLWSVGDAALEFYCADPYLYGLTEQSVSTTTYSPSSGRTYPLVYAGAGGAVRNLVLNPSFEDTFTTETTGFGTNNTRSRVNDAVVGQWCVQHAISLASVQGGTSWNIEPVAAGNLVRFGVYVKIPETGISALELWWRNQTTTLNTVSVLAQAKPGAWARVSGSFTVPAGQTVDRVSAVATSSAAGAATWWADAALAHVGGTALVPYFDGSNGGTWEGTPNASVSSRPAGTNRTYGSAGTSGRLTAVNAGASAAYPVLRLDGPVATPTIEQVTTGGILTIDATLQPGEYLLIDTRSRAVLYMGTAPRRSWVRAGSVWPLLVPGPNELAYRGDALPGAPGQSSLLTVTWRDTSL
ncbi:phage distal tail protein [Streptomyces longwoodensis]|uniref:phage distal tail protein n=1 Tax=Streptomyces longwoodensis TaxID=68231 RepID=UPI00224D0AEE|nr:phage tail domain-containing protein [Streptomyces longwoodensis]MCX4994254.1 phage tail family protein [Streptomyces longwoodensis]